MGKKKGVFVLLLALALVTAIAVGTYARYSSTASGNAAVNVAKWAFSVNTDDIVANNTFDVTVEWSDSTYVKEGYFAPGITGVAALTVDPTGSQVAVDYWVGVDTTALAGTNDSIKIIGVQSVAGTCTGATGTTRSVCETAGGTWTASTILTEETSGTHDGEYKGSIALPTDGTMTADEAIEFEVLVEWDDLNTSTANAQDTTTGAAGAASSIAITVTAEQKVA